MSTRVPSYPGTYFNWLPFDIAQIIFSFAPLDTCFNCSKKYREYSEPPLVHCSVLLTHTFRGEFKVAICVKHERRRLKQLEETRLKSLRQPIVWRKA